MQLPPDEMWTDDTLLQISTCIYRNVLLRSWTTVQRFPYGVRFKMITIFSSIKLDEKPGEDKDVTGGHGVKENQFKWMHE